MDMEKTEYNILLLGETGVGKSTLINSIINYVHYNSLEEAEENETFVIIPTMFNIQDIEGDYRTIYAGANTDCNESFNVGASSSQRVKSYIIPIDSMTNIRLIDCPGIGDTRGIETDDKNCENILSYIAHLEDLHAICLLFSPSNSRIHIFFEYCIKQILSRLEKSAVDNIMFIFTNTRGTNFTPGETYSCIKKVIDDIKERPPFVEIPFSKENIFCFDNETFRYLCAVDQGIEFDEFVTLNASISWKKSTNECLRFIIRITDNENPLRPHKTKKTISINEARKLIIYLSRPLSDISEFIQKYLVILNRHENDLNKGNQTLEELKKKLYMPVINLEVKKLAQSVTVCANKKCSDIIKVNSINKWHYKQRCHNPCYLKKIQTEIIGPQELMDCESIDPTTGKCFECGCDFSCHMHIDYETDIIDDKICNTNVDKQIKSEKEAIHEAQKLTTEIRNLQKEFIEEKDEIVQVIAEFSCFLQSHAICPFNDSYEKYLLYLIEREENLGAYKAQDILDRYKSLLAQYKQIKESIEAAEELLLKNKSNDTKTQMTPEFIMSKIVTLYKLKHTGAKIKEMYDCHLLSGKTALDKKTTEHLKPLPEGNWFYKSFKKGKKGLYKSRKSSKKSDECVSKKEDGNDDSYLKYAKDLVGNCASYVGSFAFSEEGTSIKQELPLESVTNEIEQGVDVIQLKDDDEEIIYN